MGIAVNYIGRGHGFFAWKLQLFYGYRAFTCLDNNTVAGGCNGSAVTYGNEANAAIANELDGIRNRLAEGHGIAGPLSSAQYFTPMLINMVAIGEMVTLPK